MPYRVTRASPSLVALTQRLVRFGLVVQGISYLYPLMRWPILQEMGPQIVPIERWDHLVRY
jgi:hypothetical protein